MRTLLPVLALLVTLLPAVAVPATAQVLDGDAGTIERIDVPDPVAFAVEVSRLRFVDPGSAEGAVVTTSQAFADALASSSLAGQAPLLLTAGEPEPTVIGEIARAVPPGATVYLVGGSERIPAAWQDALPNYNVVRLSGQSRVETAVAVARAAGSTDRVYLAKAGDWVDSISIGAFTAATGAPVLLTESDRLHPATAGYLAETDPAEVVLVGGTAALSADVAAAIGQPNRRVAGSTRDATAAEVATQEWGARASGGYVLVNLYADNGWTFGLPAAGLAGDRAAPLLSVHPEVDLDTTARLVCQGPAEVLAAGPESVLPSARVAATQECPAPQVTLRGDGPGDGLGVGTPMQPATG